jgi:hypothetical protein
MSLLRFRIRTLMIAVAVAAVLIPLVIDLLPLISGRAYDAWLDSSDRTEFLRRFIGW